MGAAADRHDQAVRAREVHRRLHIGYSRAARDQRRPPVDVAVPHLARGLVAIIASEQHWPAHLGAEARHFVFGNFGPGAIRCQHSKSDDSDTAFSVRDRESSGESRVAVRAIPAAQRDRLAFASAEFLK